jgi:hypothetical protein
MSVYYNNTKFNKGYPVGSIVPWTGEQGTIPKGWVPCNGTPVSKETYPMLYRVIGIAYGGTESSTDFNLPNINNGSSGILDISKQMHGYLNDLADPSIPDPLPGLNDMHRPDKEVLVDDVFWEEVQEGDGGNRPGTAQTNYVSTIDVVGELTRVQTLSAIYDQIVFNPGEVFKTLLPSSRKLSDIHWPPHTHGYTVTAEGGNNISPFVRHDGEVLDECGTGGSGSTCNIEYECADAQRPIPGNRQLSSGQGSGRVLIGNQQGMDLINTVWRCRTPSSGANQGCPSPAGTNQLGDTWYGGSTVKERSTGQDSARGRGSSFNGDGRVMRQCYSARNGNRFTFTSLTPAQSNTSYSEIAAHQHSFLGYTFSSRFYRIISPGLVQDVDTNDLEVNNSTGLNFGRITVNSSTPTLSMIYIIKAV